VSYEFEIRTLELFKNCFFARSNQELFDFQVGKIDEIFGTLRDFFVSVKLSEEVKAGSFKKGQQLYIDPGKMLPLARFLPGGDGKF